MKHARVTGGAQAATVAQLRLAGPTKALISKRANKAGEERKIARSTQFMPTRITAAATVQ